LTSFIFNELLNSDKPEELLEAAYPFAHLMMQYRCALREVQTKLEVLNTELSMDHDRNPFESIACRIKKPISIIGKLKKMGLDISIENIEHHLHDVAGIRVICTFQKDIYILAEKLCEQDDIKLLARKDYIKNPKPNGYRSLHLIVEIPVFFAEGKKYMQVEVQFRTIAMDFWASVEHIRKKLIITPLNSRKNCGAVQRISMPLQSSLKISAEKSKHKKNRNSRKGKPQHLNFLCFERFYCAIPFTINIFCQKALSAVIVTVPSSVCVPFFIYTSIPSASNLS